jgi:zinc and cadmium transporter
MKLDAAFLLLGEARRTRVLPHLVSFATGALLGAAFLALLPHAVAEVDGADFHLVGIAVLAGLVTFFVLEKVLLWRHCHHAGCDAHAVHDDHRAHAAALMILVGDGMHNFIDGVLIAAAFLADPALGWTVAIGIIAHEVPQEVGDFMILLDAGYSRRRALFLNALVSFASVAGGVLGYFLLAELQGAVPYVLALAGASFVYIAVADLMPELQRHWYVRSGLVQLVLIGSGIALVAGLHAH